MTTNENRELQCPPGIFHWRLSTSISIYGVLILFLLMVVQFGIFHSTAMAQQTRENNKFDTQWSIMTGYGTSHPGWGKTETRVETIDLALRHSTIIVDNVGSSWYKGYHSTFIELPLHFLINPDDTPMVGINFLAAYTFTSFSFQPYLFGGGGPVYVDADIEGMSTEWNGNYQFGVGLSFDLNTNHALFFECRYHHISNGNRSEPNLPLNSTKFLIGYTF